MPVMRDRNYRTSLASCAAADTLTTPPRALPIALWPYLPDIHARVRLNCKPPAAGTPDTSSANQEGGCQGRSYKALQGRGGNSLVPVSARGDQHALGVDRYQQPVLDDGHRH
jgi:hypothetical protein